MSVNSSHPNYDKFAKQWVLLRDFYEGEAYVKEQREKYLLPTAGMNIDGMNVGESGRDAYDSYLARAVFPDYVADAIEISIGLLHQKEAVIELPPELELLRNKASIKGESLISLLRRIHIEQLIPGRLGLLVDLPEQPNSSNPMPYIALYKAETILNWDESNDSINTDEVNLVVLNESGYRRVENGFNWEIRNQRRVLELRNGIYRQGIFENGSDYVDVDMRPPVLFGRPLQKIPFVFVNSKDLLPEPDNAPLIGLANDVWAIYRGEADYRYNLFMQGQDTLVVIGGTRANKAPGDDDSLRVGAGSRIDVDLHGDAKYIGVSANGLKEQRICLENDRKRAATKSGRLIGTKSNVESGEALRVRLAAQTATLTQIAITSAAALEESLKTIAIWKGADASKVKVIANLDFTELGEQGLELVNIMTARRNGAPLSLESIHENLVDKGLTVLTYEQEKEKIKQENAEMPFLAPVTQTTQPSKL
jgi:hypothetical protein